jgi:hypothetical protein
VIEAPLEQVDRHLVLPRFRWPRQPRPISTNTKNLQEQLIERDVPVLRRIFRAGFTAAALKGRGNYLCLRKWRDLSEWAADEKVGSFVRLVASELKLFQNGDVGEAAYSEDFRGSRRSPIRTALFIPHAPDATEGREAQASRQHRHSNRSLFSTLPAATLLPEYDKS